MTLGDIVRQYRSKTGLSMQEFAERSGLSRAYISILERNDNPSTGRPPIPSLETIKAVAFATGTDVNQIIAALDSSQTISLSKGFDVFTLPGIEPMPSTRKVPRLGTIACGTPILAVENHEDYDSVPEYVRCDFTVVCKGDSMVGARIMDGDIVCIHAQPMVETGEIAAVLIDDSVTLKRVYISKTHISLNAENPACNPIVIVGEDMNDVKILGKAVHFISRVR